MNTEIICNTDRTEMRNASVESFINSFDIDKVTFTEIDINDIDIAESLRNQARIHPLDNDTVVRYTREMLAGATFPPPVLAHRHGRLVVVDGNHRVASKRQMDERDLCVYIVDAPSDVIQDMTATANSKNGRQMTIEEAKGHALDLAAKGIYTYEQISGMVSHLTPTAVGLAVRAHNVRTRSKTTAAEKISDTILAPMDRIQSVTVINQLVSMVGEFGMTKTAVEDLVRHLVKSGNESEQMGYLIARRDDLAAEKAKASQPRQHRVRKDVAKANQAITMLLTLTPSAIARDYKGDKTELLIKITKATKQLKLIANELQP